MERSLCVTRWIGAGVAVGAPAFGIAGALLAGTGCTLVLPGVGTIACGSLGGSGGFAAGGAIGGTIGGLIGYFACPPDCDVNRDNRRKNHDHCMRLYELCVSTPGRHKFIGGSRCGDCLNMCESSGTWPFDRCRLNFYPHGI